MSLPPQPCRVPGLWGVMVSRNGTISDLRDFSLMGRSRWASLILHNESQVEGISKSTERCLASRESKMRGLTWLGGLGEGSSLEPG